jgi:hypothetical protein
VDTVSVDIAMKSLYKVGVRVTSLPHSEGNEAPLPADPRKCELAAFLVTNPIWSMIEGMSE